MATVVVGTQLQATNGVDMPLFMEGLKLATQRNGGMLPTVLPPCRRKENFEGKMLMFQRQGCRRSNRCRRRWSKGRRLFFWLLLIRL